MRVLMFGWEFPPFQAGGLATATLGLVKGLLHRGIEVTLVVPFAAVGTPVPNLRIISAADERPGLRSIRVDSPLMPYVRAEEYLALSGGVRAGAGEAVYGASLFDEVERYADIAELIAREEPHDLIDTHDWLTFEAGRRARAISGKPLVAHIHATEYDRCGGPGNPEIHRREGQGMSAADRVISNSHALKRQVVGRYGIPSQKIDVVHFGIDIPSDDEELEDLPVVRDRPTVLFLGRVTRQKGPEYFVELAARVSDQVPEAHFILAGTGDLLPAVIERTVELGLTGKVHFAGAVKGAEVDRLYRAADVCVMPSVSEPLGLVALESLRNGTPCVIPQESGVAEVLRHALRVDFWDVEEMANKVASLLRYPVLWEELSEAGYREVTSRRLGLDNAARRTADCYAMVTSNRLAVAT
ncbi:MAG TPA: glycosyltransferase family 4 protein [Gemmatimonadales bacterium]|jgi:glycosyltransferase involved in cell wall biosynthesis